MNLVPGLLKAIQEAEAVTTKGVTVDGFTLAPGEAIKGINALQAVGPSILTALRDKLLNLPADADAAEAILGVVADLSIPGVSADAAIGLAALKVLTLIFANNLSATPGAELNPVIFGGTKGRGSDEN